MKTETILKKLAFKLSARQIILLAVLSVVLLAIAGVHLFSSLSGTINAYLFLILLTIAIVFSKISVANQYGVSLSYFLYFGLVVVYGPLIGFLVAVAMCGIQLWIAMHQTPIDFMIHKSATSTIRQTFLYIGVCIGILVLMHFYGVQWILANHMKVYMGLLILLWVVISDMLRMIFTPMPRGQVIAMICFSMVINWNLGKYLVLKYIAWLGGFV